MTHDELLEELNEDIKAATGWGNNAWLINAKALRAVVNLHKPFNVDTDKPQCPRCMEPDFSDKGNPILVMASYPCETIQSIEKELK